MTWISRDGLHAWRAVEPSTKLPTNSDRLRQAADQIVGANGDGPRPAQWMAARIADVLRAVADEAAMDDAIVSGKVWWPRTYAAAAALADSLLDLGPVNR